MLNKEEKLSTKIFEKEVTKKCTRDGFGEGLLTAGEENHQIIALSADVSESTRINQFKEKFPERYFEVGVAEQALVTIGAGMAIYGKIPFVSSFAVFSPGRNWEQIRTTIAINNIPVKIIGSHAGVNVGADGVSHQALEDIALMRVLPNMTVIVPCDANEGNKAAIEAAKSKGPVYIRFGRQESPLITSVNTPFKIGQAEVFWHATNPQVAIIACGSMVYEALVAAKELDKKGIEALVINMHTIKPMDERAVIRAAKLTGAVLTVEEHQVKGGLGSAVSEILAENYPVPMEFIGMKDAFGESGKTDELYKKFGLKAKNIYTRTVELIARKNRS